MNRQLNNMEKHTFFLLTIVTYAVLFMVTTSSLGWDEPAPKGKPPSLETVEKRWQNRTDEYIDFLKDESFETGTYLTYMKCELTQVRIFGGGWAGPYSVHDGDIVELLCRTRRFSKLISCLENARSSGNLIMGIRTLKATVDRFIKEVGQVEDNLEQLAEQEPEIFRNDAPENQRCRFINLFRGYSLSGLPIPEGYIPMSIEGASLGLAANSFLLGLTHDPRSVAPLLKIVNYQNTEFQKKFSAVLTDPMDIVKPNSIANYVVVADGLDRILVSCAATEDENVSLTAKAVAIEYMEFRTKQNWPARKEVEMYPYDAPQTPYGLRGSLTGKVTPVKLTCVSLPLSLARKIHPGPLYERGITAQIAPILEYAERFQKAQEAIPDVTSGE
jgi:hypothetical protein